MTIYAQNGQQIEDLFFSQIDATIIFNLNNFTEILFSYLNTSRI